MAREEDINCQQRIDEQYAEEVLRQQYMKNGCLNILIVFFVIALVLYLISEV